MSSKSMNKKYLVVQTTYTSMVIDAESYSDAENKMRDLMSQEDPSYIQALEGSVDEFEAQETQWA